MTEPKKCPRCGNVKFNERDCGPDGFDDDISYVSFICTKCGLWFDGWVDNWLVDENGSNIEDWQDSEDAKEFMVRKID